LFDSQPNDIIGGGVKIADALWDAGRRPQANPTERERKEIVGEQEHQSQSDRADSRDASWDSGRIRSRLLKLLTPNEDYLADIKLFQLQADSVRELPAESVDIEKTLQLLLERHLEQFLGVRFIATEYQTGKTHGGRVDTLGLDDNNCPVIIEYKRALNENVINQGLYYLDWLMDHQGEFTLEVMKRFGRDVADNIDWSGPRLLCIAGDFTRYDEYAVHQIPRNIELLRYRRYGPDLLVLDLVNVSPAETANKRSRLADANKDRLRTQDASEPGPEHSVLDVWEALKASVLGKSDPLTLD
jgi:hypothetical protein